MPGTIWRYTTRRVLITEWVDGRSPSQLLTAAEVPLTPPPEGSTDPAAAAAYEQEREQRRQARRQVLSLVRMGVQCSLAQVSSACRGRVGVGIGAEIGCPKVCAGSWLALLIQVRQPTFSPAYWQLAPSTHIRAAALPATLLLDAPLPATHLPALQLLVTGMMHGDPHSGNLLLRKVCRTCCCCCFPAPAAKSAELHEPQHGGCTRFDR